jgi:thymidylate synthase (FAD)
LKDPLIQAHSLKDLGPQQKIWAALHQDYSHRYVWEEIQGGKLPSEGEAGKIAVKALLKGDRGHYGPIEQAGFTVACGYIPHSAMQQLRTHRIAVTFDCQSFRFTSQGVLEVAEQLIKDGDRHDLIERIIYLPPSGRHKDRHNPAYEYTEAMRQDDLRRAASAIIHYYRRVVDHGFAPQHARGMLPFDYRQHMVISFNNLRSLWHMADLRLKPDADPVAQQTVQAIWDALTPECPELNEWYTEVRLKKGRLSP